MQFGDIVARQRDWRRMRGDVLRVQNGEAEDLDAAGTPLELDHLELWALGVERAQERGQPRERDLIPELGPLPEDDLVTGLQSERVRIEPFVGGLPGIDDAPP